MTRTKKRLSVCIGASVFSALSTRIWTDNAGGLQMAAYSALVLGMLWIGFGEDRRRSRFWPAVLLVLALHSGLLYFGSDFFPVKTTFLLWPAAGLEGTLLGLLLIWFLGKWSEAVRQRGAFESRRRSSRTSGGRI